MIDLREQDRVAINQILKRHLQGTPVKAFGSRTKGRARKFSDLDLVICGPEPLSDKKMDQIHETFACSDIPIIVDIKDWHSISDDFKKIIEDQLVPFDY